ncbi:MAG: hypothetical protein IKX92_05625 [Clostridia bacterium]|nr:hypothetical protein [Clostridia bacterium]
MKNKTKFLRVFALFAAVLLAASSLPLCAGADTGPKPSVSVKFENLPEGECWATLLSEKAQHGPYEAFPGGDRKEYYDSNASFSGGKPDYDTWNALTDYADADGFFYLQYCFRVDETKEFEWSYMPPDRFKILLYYPGYGTFFVSGAGEAYAFDSYFTVDMQGADAAKGGTLEPHASYNYGKEILGLAGRIALTVIIELAVAILFGFRHKKPLLLILGVNAVTQILLNAALNLISRHIGFAGVLFAGLFMEIVIIAAEATIYCIYMKRLEAGYDNERYIIGYTAVANVASFVAGLAFALLFPAMF